MKLEGSKRQFEKVLRPMQESDVWQSLRILLNGCVASRIFPRGLAVDIYLSRNREDTKIAMSANASVPFTMLTMNPLLFENGKSNSESIPLP